MLLSQDELQSLVHARHRAPHQLLGMHPLGDGSGIVVRALLPNAAKVEIQPTLEKQKPAIQLQQLDRSGLYEGVSKAVKEVYAYDLVITDYQGQVRRTRDAYSFLPTLGETDLYLFGKGDERRIYEKLGAQLRTIDGVPGTSFAVWAPNAQRVSVVGDFNGWDGRYHPMRLLGASGVWELFVPGLGEGTHYKYEVKNIHGATVLKSDPYGFFFEAALKNASIVWNTSKFKWTDAAWCRQRRERDHLRSPMSIYEVHLGSWRKKSVAESFSYRELARMLIPYVKQMGFTHVELLPVAEHAFYPSWGYQVTGFYSPTARYGTPDDFQFFVNAMHEAGIGVIIDWVPAHFPRDDWALARFDGTALYEHEDPRKGAHQDWGTLIFNYGRHEVCNFLLANALFWCERFHIDGLRVDAVASMLYLDYSRKHGEWTPNPEGGNDNKEAIAFLRRANELVYGLFPGAITIAEESTAWPGVSQPTSLGGLGFGFKWNMGWMHDTLDYISRDPVHRRWSHERLTFGLLYAFSENFVLPISHDEVVHGKGSVVGKIPGDEWQKFATARAYYGFMWGHPGKKLLFMGQEFGQTSEWNFNEALPWWLTEFWPHKGLQAFIRDLNELYRRLPALHARDSEPEGFRWIVVNDEAQSVVAFLRMGADGDAPVAVVCNFTPVPRHAYRIGLPAPGHWREALNSDAAFYGGSNMGNLGGVTAEPRPAHGFGASALLTLPPLATLFFEFSPGQP